MTHQHKFWSDVAVKGEESPNMRDHAQADLEIINILSLLTDIKFDSLLEIGCANGVLLQKIRNHYPQAKLVGVDFVAKFLEQAKTHSTDIAYLVDDAATLTSLKGPFDVVLSRRCLINLSTKQQQKAFNRIYDLLADNGTFILVESYVQGYMKLNEARAKAGLTPISVAKHNQPLDLTRLDLSKWVVAGHDGFSAYYYLTRLLLPLLTKPDEPTYDTRLHWEAVKLQATLGGFRSDLCPLLFWSLKRKKP